MNNLGDNTLGTRFKITSFGESHGEVIGIVVDGVPAGLKLDKQFMQEELNKRKPGQSKVTTSRAESDEIKVISGLFKGMTTGAPICCLIENKDVDSSKYEKFKDLLRPSQVDYSALLRYGGYADYRGSGRFSGRITAGYVMAGAIAKQLLALKDVEILAYSKSIGNVIDDLHHEGKEFKELMQIREENAVRTLNPIKAREMEDLIIQVKKENDSIGGIIKCLVKNFPEGIGNPVFNSIESQLSKAIFSIPAVKGIEFGAGFEAAEMKGSEHNDPWIIKNEKIMTSKNDCGGIIGGISTGMPIEFNVVIKPTATIGKPQKTVNMAKMDEETIQLSGRHDPCIVPRAIVVVEAMTAVCLADFLILEGFIPKIIK